MNDRSTSTNLVVAGSLWAATALMFVVAGLVMVHGQWMAAIFIAELACGLSAYAAVRHLKCYAVRICQKIDESDLERDVARLSAFPRQQRAEF